jgi:hypothetical protein
MSWTDLRAGVDYSQLDERGIIKEGTVIDEHTVLVGRYLKNAETGGLKDASLMPTVFTKGRVDKVAVIHQASGTLLIKVRVLEERIPELGDKFSSRHGQKGTMGMLLNAVDMPCTAEGMVPDVMVNPHCIPSRMTIAQLLEQIFGKLGAITGAKMNATSFMNDDQSLKAIGDVLEALGIQRQGEEIMYSGTTGKMFTTSVFIGPLYFMRLKHLTQDKINSRASGRKEIRTHQPTGGRGNEGGMRIGEMERDALVAHGVTDFLQESMMKRSDGTSFVVCNGCGTIPIYNPGQNLYVCPTCDGPLKFQGETADTLGLILPVKKSRATFSTIEVPYALKLLDQELTTFMNAGFRFVTARHMRHFRDTEEIEDELATAEMSPPKLEVAEPDVEPEEDDEAELEKNLALAEENANNNELAKHDELLMNVTIKPPPTESASGESGSPASGESASGESASGESASGESASGDSASLAPTEFEDLSNPPQPVRQGPMLRITEETPEQSGGNNKVSEDDVKIIHIA